MADIDLLYRALGRASEAPPGDLLAGVAALPAVGELPAPWEAWTLIGLVRHRRRQLWVGEIVTERLSGGLSRLAQMGALGHPAEMPQSGSVPGLPEWEYYYHGRGCCLTHKVTGEAIDVDFFDDTAEYFDIWFYEQHLKSLRTPELPERRLLELHPSVSPVRLAIGPLLEAGALAPLESEGGAFRLAEMTLRHEAAIDAFCAAWADEGRRPWLTALVGDWPAAHDAAVRAGDGGLAALAAVRAARCRDLRRERLRQVRDDGRLGSDAVRALADLGGAEADEAIAEALRGPLTGAASAALEAVKRQDHPAWCPAVFALSRRADPNGQLPEPFVWIEAIRYLVRHNHRRDEVLDDLSRAGGCVVGEAALLALEHAPELARPLIWLGLRSRVPMNRCTVAAVLAVIDRPWSRRELIAAMNASSEQEPTTECRAALLECRDEQAHAAVRAWEERNPHEPEAPDYLEVEGRTVGPFVSMGELWSRVSYVAPMVRYEMQKLHDRVLPLRDRAAPP